MAKDKYYFEIDSEKVLELTPTEIPEYKHEVDISKKIKDTWDMLYRENFDTTIYIDDIIVPITFSQDLYNYMKELNLLSEDDILSTDDGVKFKVVVQPELPDGAYYFGVGENK